MSLGDNVKTKFGNSDELQIYHTGSSALIQESGDGDLGILGANIVIANADASKNYIGCTDNANVTLFYNGNPKLNTVASGIDVTGTVTFDGLSGTGSVNVTDILDEDDMSSNSATALATQQSIKAYVDANAGGIALTDISVSGTEGTASGDGGIGYDNTTGVFTYTPPDLSSYLTSFDITTQTDPKYLRSDADDTTTGTITAAGLIVDTDTLYVDATNDRVGIGTTSPDSTLHVDGIITSTANPVFKKDVPVIEFRSPDGTNGMNIKANLNNTNNYGLQFEDVNGLNKVVIDPLGDVSFYNETSAFYS